MRSNLYSRRQFTTQMLGGAITLGLSPSLWAQNPSVLDQEIDWFDVKEIGVEGKRLE